MPRKPFNHRQLLRLAAYYGARLLGRTRKADLLYVRMLEGWLSWEESEMLYDTVRGLGSQGDIIEVGSYKGKSTVLLGFAVRRAGRNDTIYAIDHHLGSEEHQDLVEASGGSTWNQFLETIQAAGVGHLIHPVKLDSAKAAAWLREINAQAKLLFLDGAHDEDSVAKDIQAYFPLVRTGGLIAMDDAKPDGDFPGVYRAYERLIKHATKPLGWAKGMLLLRKECESLQPAP